MAGNTIDISQDILKKLDYDCKTLNKLLFDALEVVTKLKITWEALAEVQKIYTKH